jgi:hypothetical protein
MILADTSVWIEHFRRGEPSLASLLSQGQVLLHPFVSGELACGNLRNRRQILADLGALPVADAATHNEVLRLVEQHKLWGRGIGWVDAHLIASALLSHCRLWSLDRQLGRAADVAGVKPYRP